MAELARKPDGKVLEVVDERAVVRKHRKLTGGVRVRTIVHEEERQVDALLQSENVEVERIRLDRWVDQPIPVREEGDVTIVTLHEEVVVVEKRLKAIEEIRLVRRHGERRAPQRVVLRREEAVVEKLAADPTGQD